MTFELHPNLIHKLFIIDLPLCRVMMEDEKHYPWLFLIPRQANLARTIDLTLEDQMQLLKELNLVQKALWDEFQPTQLNVAAIGNKTPQLHVHVVVRYASDPAWPHTVWDHPIRCKYSDEDKKHMIDRIQSKLTTIKN